MRGVAKELMEIAKETDHRIQLIREPSTSLQLLVWTLLSALCVIIIILPMFFSDWGHVNSVLEFIQNLEPMLGCAFFITAFVLYLLSIERGRKRSRALDAIHELRSLAHVIDMHQLTKDPVMLIPDKQETENSPRRTMTSFELSRYFDYCTEMLSLISKVSALYIEDFPDSVAITAVDEVENLTSGLSRKIWQKIALLDRHSES